MVMLRLCLMVDVSLLLVSMSFESESIRPHLSICAVIAKTDEHQLNLGEFE